MKKAYEPSGGFLMEEKQRFPRWLVIMLIAIVSLTLVGMAVMAIMMESERGEALLGLAIAAPIEIVVIYAFLKARLETVVTTNGFYYRWRPLQGKYRLIEKEDIRSFEFRDAPMLNYGYGWFPGYGRFHNADRGEGLQLYLKNGSKVFFSSRETALLQKAMEQLLSSNRKTDSREF